MAGHVLRAIRPMACGHADNLQVSPAWPRSEMCRHGGNAVAAPPMRSTDDFAQ